MKKSQLRRLIREEIKKSYTKESVNEITPAQQKYVVASNKPSKPKKTQFRKDIEGAKRMMDSSRNYSAEEIIKKYGIAAVNAVNAENEYGGDLDLEESVSEDYASFVEEFLSNNTNFSNAIDNLKSGLLTKENILKLAKRYEVNPQDAIRFVKEMYKVGTTLDEND